MKKIFMGALIMLLTLFAPLMAQQKSDTNLTGHVTDSSTGEHLPYVTIALLNTNIRTTTDSTGHYMLTNLPIGTFTINVSFLGYESFEEEVTLRKGETYIMHFKLTPKQYEIEELVVTGNRYATKKRETHTVVNVVSPRLFESTVSSSPAQVLDFQSGTRVEYSCGNCGVPQLRINGLPGQYSQVLLDSRPLFSSLAMVYGLEQLPSAMIERIEVVRGGGSALYGSNAIGGTVNIITKEPTSSTVQLANQTGFMRGARADISTTLNGSLVSSDYKTGAYIFSMVRHRDDYDRNNDLYSEIPRLKSITLGARAYHKITDHSKLTAEYHHIYEYRRGGDSLDVPAHQSHLAEQLEHHINGGSLSYDLNGKRQSLNIYTSLQHVGRDSYFGTHQNPNAYGNTSDITVNAGAMWLYTFDKLWFMPSTLTLGGDYSYNKLHDKMLGYGREIKQTTHLGGFYAQNEWKNEKLSLLIGVRADKHSLINKPILSPRATIRYAPSKSWTLRASYAKGYRAPQVYDEDLHVGAVGGQVSLISLAEDLRPEHSTTINASVDYWKTLGHWQLNALVEGFYTRLDDVFALVEKGHDAQGNLLLTRTNAPGAVVRGANVELRVANGEKINLQTGVTLQQSRYKEPFSWSESVEAQKKMLRAPNCYGYFTLDYKPVGSLQLSLNGVYTGPMLVNHYAGYIASDSEVMTKSFFDLSARVAYKFQITSFTAMELSVSCKNITDDFQSDIDCGVDKDSKYIYGPAMPRTIYAGVKFEF